MRPMHSFTALRNRIAFSANRSAIAPLICFSAVACLFTVFDAQAQVRAALVKDTEAAGRVPYEYNIEFSNGCVVNCSNFLVLRENILFDGPPVPAGKRLVLQWISARVPAVDSRVKLALQASRVVSQQDLKWSFHGPFFLSGFGSAGMSSAIFATYGPGESPHINIENVSPAANTSGYVTLAGYLIDATN